MPIVQQELSAIPAPGRRVGVLREAGISPATYYRRLQPKPPRARPQRPASREEEALCESIRALLERHSRWGYRKVWARLRREQPGLAQGRVYRLMRHQGWLQPRGKRPAAMKRERFPEVSAPNQRAETLVRTLQLAVEEAERLGGWEGLPGSPEGAVLVVSDNGPGFKARLLREYFRASEGRLRHRRIRRETPEHNGRVERLAGTLEYEIGHRLEGLDPLEAGLALVSFRHEYNHERPHMALDYRFPIEAYLERTTVPADRHNPPED